MTGLVVVLVLVVAAIVVTPEAPPAFEGGARAARQGMPHLGLYLVAALVLAVTTQAPRASGSVDAEKRETRWLAFWLAAALVVAAVNTVRLDGDMTARGSVLLWLVSVAFVVVAAVTPSRRRRSDGDRERPLWARWSALIVTALLVVAALLRFLWLARVPVNVQADEGDRAASALDVLDGVAPASWFDSGWFYVNMVYFRVLALVFDVFGVGVVQGRLVNATAGLVLVAAVGWIGFRDFDTRVGIVATALAATSPLALQFSRTIAESGVGAALFAVSLAGFLEGARTGRSWGYALAGLSGGLSLYTYAAARSWPLAAAATIAVLLVSRRRAWRSVARGGAVAAAAAVVAAAPFAVHLHRHSDELNLRFRQTTVLSAENRERLAYLHRDTSVAEVLPIQLERSLGLFDRYPDGIDFFPTGRPIFPRLLAALTLLGVFYASFRGVRDERFAILALWFWIGLAGVFLTVETPAAQRAAGLLVTLPLLAAAVLIEMASRVATALGAWRRAPAGRAVRVTDAAVASLVVGLMAVQTWQYFVDYRKKDEPWSTTTREARHIAALGRTGPVYSLERMEHRVKSGWVRFLARGTVTGSLTSPGDQLPLLVPDEPYRNLAPRQQIPVPSRDETISFVLYGPEQRPYLALLGALYGSGIRVSQDDRMVFQVPPASTRRRRGVRLRSGRSVTLVSSFGRIPADTPLPAELRWSAGIRVAYPGRHCVELTAPVGSRLFVDGIEVAAERDGRVVIRELRVPRGLHYVELRAPVRSHDERITLELERPTGPSGARIGPFAPSEQRRPTRR